MKFIFTLVSLITAFTIKAQDTIVLKSKLSIVSKVVEVSSENVKYKKIENVTGPDYLINVSEVLEIHFENGFIEKSFYSGKPSLTIEETKRFIVDRINQFGWEEDEDGRYQATFEGNKLRLVVLRKNGTPFNGGILYDFGTVYKFQDNSVRANSVSFINIYVSILKSAKRDTWDKHKLIMRVHGHQQADEILSALKHLNQLLLSETRSSNPF